MIHYLLIQGPNLLLLIVSLCLLYTVISGAPYLPTNTKCVEDMVAAAHVTSATKMVDIGSGDGRIVIAFAKAGAEAHGYEINPLLVWYSQWKIRRAGLEKRAFIHTKSFWQANFSSFNVATVFGITRIMPKLEKKLAAEMPNGSLVLSHVFTFPTLRLVEKRPQIRVYAIDKENV